MEVERRGCVIRSYLSVNPQGEEPVGKPKPQGCIFLPFRLNDGSRMSGDAHVRFCEGLGVKFPGATLYNRSDRPVNPRKLTEKIA